MNRFVHAAATLLNRRRCCALWLVLLQCLASGCTAMTNPIADGIPVRLLPPELWGPSKANLQTIPLTMLRQSPPDAYRLAPGDVLGVFVDGFLGERTQPIPTHVPPLVDVREAHRLAPAAGYPVPVQEDGTIALPSVPKLRVQGLTVGEAHEAVRNLYLKKELLRANNERVVVTLLNPRQTQVLVMRQEATGFQIGADGGAVSSSKRNSGFLVDLPAYQNDVLHALAKTGGLPDFDAYNEIIIHRDALREGQTPQEVAKQLQKLPPGAKQNLAQLRPTETIRIPLRQPVGAPVAIGPNDILLKNGDVIFLEARDEQVFFTAGLLPPGKHSLPRDQDLDVLEAVAQVRGPLYNGAFGGSNLAGNLIAPGTGNPSPSLLIVVRRVPNRGQLHIAVDLRDALRHPQERLRIQPGDVLVLQERPSQALVRYMSQTFFNFDIFYTVFRSSNGAGIVDIAAPDRLTNRTGSITLVP
jgi:protein involved in polysaccharide export with SLBB domain